MGLSIGLVTNPDASDGLTGWAASNVSVVGSTFVLSGTASMSQTKDLSLLDFTVNAFKVSVQLTFNTASATMEDFIKFKIVYSDGTSSLMSVPLQPNAVPSVLYDGSWYNIETTIDAVNIVSSVEIIVDKNSSGSITINSIDYQHIDNPFTEDVLSTKQPNSIIADSLGLHIYDGNAFDGASKIITIGEYSSGLFGFNLTSPLDNHSVLLGQIDNDGETITGLKITGAQGQESIIDKFGLNPKYLDYSKNLIWNSSFEVADSSNKPYYWAITGTGEASKSSSFYGDRSLKLASGALARQHWAAGIDPDWISRQIVRVSMYANFVQDFKVRVVDIGTWVDSAGALVQYYELTSEDATPATELTFTGNNGWEDSRISFTFDSNEFAGDSVKFALEIENVGTGDIYIDGVMAHIDFTGSWPQLYKAGPRSISFESLGDAWTDSTPLTEDEPLSTFKRIVVSDTEPSDTSVLWYDTSS